jgi:hypothetical protein
VAWKMIRNLVVNGGKTSDMDMAAPWVRSWRRWAKILRATHSHLCSDFNFTFIHHKINKAMGGVVGLCVGCWEVWTSLRSHWCNRMKREKTFFGCFCVFGPLSNERLECSG